MIKLSVIVSSYNRKKYLNELMESLISQIVPSNIEIIIVDDNSDTDTKKLIQEYANNYSFLKVILNDVNKGLFHSRLAGLEMAKGKYVRFFDDDDLCPSNSLARSINLMEKYNSEIIRFNHNTINKGVMEDGWLYKDIKSFFNDKEKFLKHCSVGGVVLNIIKKDFAEKSLKNIEKFNINQMEDDLINSTLIQQFHNISFIQENLYTVRVSEYSMSNLPWQEKDFNDAILVLSSIYENSSKIYLYMYMKHKLNGLIDSKLRVMSKTSPISRNTFEKFFNIVNKIIYKANIPENIIKGHFSRSFYLKSHIEAYNKILDLHADGEPLPGRMDIINADIISFDIFDTLIERPVLSAMNVYEALNIKANQILGFHTFDFAKMRINCENRIRTLRKQESKELEEDVTLEEIYIEIARELQLNEIIQNQLLKLEIEIELKLCSSKKIGKRLYDFALESGKKIILISDMYLGKQHIEEILNKSGYKGWHELYVSSEVRKLKSTGKLVEHVDNLLKQEKKIYHIGDNLHSDILSTRAYGWKAGYVPKSVELLKRNNAYMNILDNIKDISLGTNTVFGLIANRLYSDPLEVKDLESLFNGKVSNIGYCALGPFVFSIVLSMLRCETSKYVFVARDGYIPKQAMDYISNYFGYNISTTYLKASRLSYLPIFIENNIEINSLENRYIDNNYTINDFLKFHLLLTEQEIKEISLDKYNLNLNDKFNLKTGYIKKLLQENKYLLDNALDARKNLVKYINQEIPDNKGGITVFDSGNQGSIQKCIEIATRFENVEGYYINTNNGVCDRFYLDTHKVSTYFDNYTTSTCPLNREIIETFLSSTEGSCIGYEYNNGEMVALEGVSEHNEDAKKIIHSVQEGIMEFIVDICNLYDKDNLLKTYFNKEHLSSIFKEFSSNPQTNDQKLLSGIFLNDVFSSVRKKSLINKNISNNAISSNTTMTSKQNIDILIELAMDKFKKEKYSEALDLLLNNLSMRNLPPRVHRMLAEIYINMKQDYAALNHLQIARTMIPGNKNLRYRYYYLKYGKYLFFFKNKPFI